MFRLKHAAQIAEIPAPTFRAIGHEKEVVGFFGEWAVAQDHAGARGSVAALGEWRDDDLDRNWRVIDWRREPFELDACAAVGDSGDVMFENQRFSRVIPRAIPGNREQCALA